MTPKEQAAKEKMHWSSSKLKTFFCIKGHYQKLQRQIIRSDQIFASHVSDQTLVSRI